MRFSPQGWILPLVLAAALITGCSRTPSELLELARAAESKGDLSTAIVHVKGALQAEPDDARIRLRLGRLYIAAADAVSAEKELRRARESGQLDAGEIDAELAHALWLIGSFKAILDEVRVPEQAAPETLATILAFRGRAQRQVGQIEEARASLAKVHALSGETHKLPVVQLLEAHIRIAERNLPEAERLVDAVLAADPKLYDAMRLKAELLSSQGNESAAVEAYGAILKQYPTDLYALVNRSTVLIRQAKFDEAERDVKVLETAHKSHFAGPLQMGLLKLRKGQFRGAVEALQSAHKRNPSYTPVLRWLGIAHLAVGEALQAERVTRQYLETNPRDLAALRVLAAALLQLNEPARALEVITPVLATGHADTGMYELAGEASARAGDLAKALEWFDRASKAQPENARLREQRAMVQIVGGQIEPALGELETLVQTQTRPSAADIVLFAAHLKRGELDKAQAALERLEKKSPNDAFVLNLRGIVLLQKDQRSDAVAAFESALRKQPGFLPAAANLIKLDLEAGKPDVARQRIGQVLAADKAHLQALLLASELAKAEKKPGEAIEFLKRATRAHPTYAESWVRLIALLLQERDHEEAKQVAQEFSTRNPKSFAAAEMTGRVQLARGESNSAVATYTRLATEHPMSEKAHLLLAEAQLRAERVSDAERTLRRILEFSPDDRQAQLVWVGLMIKERRGEEAKRYAKSVQKARASSPTGWVLEADIDGAQSKFADAAKALESALTIAPRDDIAIRLYDARVKAGDGKKALAGLRQFVEQRPNAIGAGIYLAEVLVRSGDYAGAVKHYEPATKTSNATPMLLNNLAYAYYKLNDSRARDIGEQALRAAPESPLILDTVGMILLRHGDAKRALDLLERAASKLPDHPAIRFHFAAALHKAGDVQRARNELAQLLQKHSSFPERDEAVALLKSIGA